MNHGIKSSETKIERTQQPACQRITLCLSTSLKEPIELPHLKKWRVNDSDAVIYGTVNSRIKAKGYFLDRISPIAYRYMTVTSKGILMIYESDNKGYVLNLRKATSVLTETYLRKTGNISQRCCQMKIKYKFGTISLFLVNAEISAWRLVIGDYHDGQICDVCVQAKNSALSAKRKKSAKIQTEKKENLENCEPVEPISVVEAEKNPSDVSSISTNSEQSIWSRIEKPFLKPKQIVSIETSLVGCETTEAEISSQSGLTKSLIDGSPVGDSRPVVGAPSSNDETPIERNSPLKIGQAQTDLSALVPVPPPVYNRFGALPGFPARQRCRNTRVSTIEHTADVFSKSTETEVTPSECSVRHGAHSVASIRRLLEDTVSKKYSQHQKNMPNSEGDVTSILQQFLNNNKHIYNSRN